mmetsp:Transcript_124603/g.398988  ORF Transcript_124603/g.398988 Transcript_124603/m.398988 type:complete len:642 (-) Transcript_124603:538-2463(-)
MPLGPIETFRGSMSADRQGSSLKVPLLGRENDAPAAADDAAAATSSNCHGHGCIWRLLRQQVLQLLVIFRPTQHSFPRVEADVVLKVLDVMGFLSLTSEVPQLIRINHLPAAATSALWEAAPTSATATAAVAATTALLIGAVAAAAALLVRVVDATAQLVLVVRDLVVVVALVAALLAAPLSRSVVGVSHDERRAQGLWRGAVEQIDGPAGLLGVAHLYKRMGFRPSRLHQQPEPHNVTTLSEGLAQLLLVHCHGQPCNVQVGAGLRILAGEADAHGRHRRGENPSMQSLDGRLGLRHICQLHQRGAVRGLAPPRVQDLQTHNVAVLREDRSQQELGATDRQTLHVQVVRGHLLRSGHLGLDLREPDRHLGLQLRGSHAVEVRDDSTGFLHGRHLHQSCGILDRLPDRRQQDATPANGAARPEESVEVFLRAVQRQALHIQVVVGHGWVLAVVADDQGGRRALWRGAVQHVDSILGCLYGVHPDQSRALGRVLVAQDLHFDNLARPRKRLVQIRLGGSGRQALDIQVVAGHRRVGGLSFATFLATWASAFAQGNESSNGCRRGTNETAFGTFNCECGNGTFELGRLLTDVCVCKLHQPLRLRVRAAADPSVQILASDLRLLHRAHLNEAARASVPGEDAGR